MSHWAKSLGGLAAAFPLFILQPHAALAAANNPELVARNYAGTNGAQPTHPLTISRLSVDVDVAGGVARTVVEATFQNPTGAALEGDFVLDLPPGSVVTAYALDVNGTMVDGVLEGQRRATLAYQRRVRAGADPGLAEVTRGNAFRTHVFPIFPGRGRTIRMAFVTPIAPGQPLRLPLATLDAVGQAAIKVTVKDGARPRVVGPDGAPLEWLIEEPGAAARWRGNNVVLSGALSVEVPALPDRPLIARHAGGDAFFEVAGQADAAAARAGGGRLRIFWDRSLSRRHDDLAKEQDLVARTIAALRPDAVDLVLFADDEPRVLSFQGPDAARGVAAALNGVDYAGATSLRHVLGAGPGRADVCLFMSDGRITVDAFHIERAPCALFTLSSGADADHGFLAALARRSGGEHFDLAAVPAADAAARIAQPGARVVQLTADGADADFTVLPAGPNGFRVVGKALNVHRVAVTFAGGRTRSFDLDGADSVEHDGLGALWGADRIAEVNASDRPDLDRALALGRRYQVAGGGAVFVVLENLQDYVTAEIQPPDSAGKDVQREYARQIEAQNAAKAQAQAARLDAVIAAWKQEHAWWVDWRTDAPARGPDVSNGAVGGRPPPESRAMRREDAAAAADSTTVSEDVVTAARQRGPERQERDGRTASDQALAPPPPAPPPPNGALAARPSAPAAAPPAEGEALRNPQAGRGGIEIAVEAWDPNRPYLKALKAPGADFAATFKAQQAVYGDQPAFYLDVAEFLFRQGKIAEAQVMARSALETPTADTTTMIIVADRMMRYGDEDRAIWMYEKVLYLDPDRPQPRRSLALALVERAERAAKRGAPAEAQRADLTRAMDLLNEVITRTWDGAFTGVEDVALVEANHLLPRLQALGVRDIPLDPRLRAPIDVDLRVVLEWNVDATDMDLWVDEPSGERVIYNHNRSHAGGRLSHDFTQGYGPEEYLLRRAPAGDYTVRANIYRSDRLNPNGPITIRAHLFRDYGRPTEKHEILDLEVRPGEDGARVVGEVKVGR